jgi:predicted nucleotidyltransferase
VKPKLEKLARHRHVRSNKERAEGSAAPLPGQKGYRMRGASSVTPGDLTIAKEFVRRLAERIDSGRFQVTLFGSRARGDADEESDLDLLVRLNENDSEGVVKAVVSHIACDLTLEHGILVAAFVADEKFVNQHEKFSFLETVEKEGVPL